ncbi:MAG: WD40 repeat domain-containing protein [Cyanobacteriota bacterium]
MRNLQKCTQLGILNGHTFPVTALAFSPDGETLISAGDDTIRLWNLTSGKLIRTLRAHAGNWSESAVTSLAVSSNGRFIASGGTDGRIKIWNLKQFIKSEQGKIVTLIGHAQRNWLAQGVRSIAFSADGKILASGGGDKVIKLWDTKTWQEISTLAGHSDAIASLAFSPVEPVLISTAGCTIKLWKLDTNEETTFTASSVARTVAFNANGQTFVTGGLKGAFSLWVLQTGEEVIKDTLHSEEICAIAFSSNGKFFATGSCDKTVKLWNAITGDLIDTFTGHSEAVYSLTFCPDNSILASGSADKSIRLWKVV